MDREEDGEAHEETIYPAAQLIFNRLTTQRYDSWQRPYCAKEPAVISLTREPIIGVHVGVADQPFCDGSHQGTGFEPVEFTVAEKKEVALCQCKQTKTPPYCDGTHQTPERNHAEYACHGVMDGYRRGNAHTG